MTKMSFVNKLCFVHSDIIVYKINFAELEILSLKDELSLKHESIN